MKKVRLILIGIFVFLVLIFVAAVGAKFIYKKYLNQKNSIILKEPTSDSAVNILFLHHSTGKNIWRGGVSSWFKDFNRKNDTDYQIVEQSFPKHETHGYGWENNPYDYWNIWVNNQGSIPYKNEPTLEMITEKYDIVIWKHCFPVSDILPDTGSPVISSKAKRIENYKLHYQALKEKMLQFSKTKFIVWTGAARVKGAATEEAARLARSFFNWVKDEWDQPDDNIFLWDFFELETEGGLYFKDKYATSESNSHPNKAFSKKVAPFLCQRIVNVIEGRGDRSNITGI